jgi:hypothetical protein
VGVGDGGTGVLAGATVLIVRLPAPPFQALSEPQPGAKMATTSVYVVAAVVDGTCQRML